MRQSPIILLVLLLALVACADREHGKAGDSELTIFSPVNPVSGIVSAVSGDRASVRTLLRPGQDPHSAAMSPSVVEALARADLFVGAGLPIEHGIVSRVGKPGIWYLNVIEEEHAHEPGYDHAHHDHEDPHVWLSPRMLVVSAERIRDHLSRIDPEGAQHYQDSFLGFAAKVGQTAEEARAVLEPYAGMTFYVQHAAFEHFAEFFGLEQVALEAHGREPTPRDISRLAERARSEGVKVVFTQPQQNPEPLLALAKAIGADVRTLDPLAEDPLVNILQIARQLALAFELQTTGDHGNE